MDVAPRKFCKSVGSFARRVGERIQQYVGEISLSAGISTNSIFPTPMRSLDTISPPPSLRRSIGILDFLHKRVLGICHPLLVQALPFAERLDANYHTKALHPFSGEVRYHASLYGRSLYMYILI